LCKVNQYSPFPSPGLNCPYAQSQAVGHGPSGSGGQGTGALPADFKANALWSGSIGIVASTAGTVFVTSTPSIASDAIVERAISSGANTNSNAAINVLSSFSSSSSSGDLQRPGHGICTVCGGQSNPLPNGGDLGLNGDSAGIGIGNSDPKNGSPYDPLGGFTGHGHASATRETQKRGHSTLLTPLYSGSEF
jgi:hypothetical protein